MRLHHRSGQVDYKQLDVAVEFFTANLDCRELLRTKGTVFLRQGDASVDLQLVGTRPFAPQHDKELSHIAFASDNPREDRQRLCDWLTEHGQECEVGEWSEAELWLGAPGLFFDFAIEIFDSKGLAEMDYPATGSADTD